MKMKIPTSPVGNGCYEPSAYEFDDDLEVPSDIENDNDFSEYLWMENQEEFDKLEMQRLEEEELMRQCVEAMLEDELEAELARLENASNTEELCDVLSSLSVSNIIPITTTTTTTPSPSGTTVTVANVENSTLNPLAAEFVPAVSLVTPTTT